MPSEKSPSPMGIHVNRKIIVHPLSDFTIFEHYLIYFKMDINFN